MTATLVSGRWKHLLSEFSDIEVEVSTLDGDTYAMAVEAVKETKSCDSMIVFDERGLLSIASFKEQDVAQLIENDDTEGTIELKHLSGIGGGAADYERTY